MKLNITGNVNSSGLGSEWNNPEEAAKLYADFLEERFEEAFASDFEHCNIRITGRSHEVDVINWNVEGFVGEDGENWEDVHEAEFEAETDFFDRFIEVSNKAFEDFCELGDRTTAADEDEDNS